MSDLTSSLEQTSSKRTRPSTKDNSTRKRQTAKRPKLTTTAVFDGNNPFTEGNVKDEIELRFEDGNSLFVSESFLSYSSQVFTRMFQSEFMENDSKIVDLKGKSYDAFLEMLLHLHPRVQKPIAGERAEAVYRLAHEYDIPTVLQTTELILKCQIASLTVSTEYRSMSAPEKGDHNKKFLNKGFDMLVFADTYGNKALLSAAAERISMLPMESFTEHPAYNDLAESTKNKLLMYRLKRYDKSEISLKDIDLVY